METDSNEQSSSTSVSVPAELIEAAADELGVDSDRLKISERVSLAPSQCRLISAVDSESTGHGRPFVILADGSLFDFTVNGLDDLVNSCYFEPQVEPEPASMAQLIMAVGNSPGSLAVARDTNRQMFENVGVEYVEPVLTIVGDETQLVFLAQDFELFDLYRVTATHAGDRSFAVEYERLG